MAEKVLCAAELVVRYLARHRELHFAPGRRQSAGRQRAAVWVARLVAQDMSGSDEATSPRGLTISRRAGAVAHRCREFANG